MHGGVGWQIGLPWNQNALIGCVAIYHQVRRPMDTISSMLTHKSGVLEAFSRATGEDLPAVKLDQCAAAWCMWNEYCEAMAEQTFRVEDMNRDSQLFVDMLDWFGIDNEAARQPPTNTNHRTHTQHRLSDIANELLRERVRGLGRRYGYEV